MLVEVAEKADRKLVLGAGRSVAGMDIGIPMCYSGRNLEFVGASDSWMDRMCDCIHLASASRPLPRPILLISAY